MRRNSGDDGGPPESALHADPPPAIQLAGISKAFGTVRANDGVSLEVAAGTIHGVIGENGAGKSTAMKILYGLYAPDSGVIRVEGVERSWDTPSDAIAAGIGMVHQHFMLAGPHTALDNVLLGAEPVSRRWRWVPRALQAIDREAARRRLEELSRKYHLPVPWSDAVETLPVGIQQRIEILKLLYRDARILILDEPTAVLTPQETHELFANLRRLRDEGKTIVIITHKLREVMELTDRVTVMRAGKVTGEVATRGSSPQELADLMVGRKVALRVEAPPPPKLGETALELDGVSVEGPVKPKLSRVSLRVRGGEIVGIAGVEGNGQSDLLRAILRPLDTVALGSGTVKVLGQDVTRWGTRAIKDLGVAFIPEDRQRDGLLLGRSAEENYLLGQHRREPFARRGVLRPKALRKAAQAAMEEFDVRPRRLAVPAGGMSGGNQQKLIIARELRAGGPPPRLIVAAQPTRGVDVGAIEFIHQRLLQARALGSGVLLVSSELDEVMALSDRILVMYEGAVVAELERGAAKESEIGFHMGGGRR